MKRNRFILLIVVFLALFFKNKNEKHLKKQEILKLKILAIEYLLN